MNSTLFDIKLTEGIKSKVRFATLEFWNLPKTKSLYGVIEENIYLVICVACLHQISFHVR